MIADEPSHMGIRISFITRLSLDCHSTIVSEGNGGWWSMA